MEEEDWYDAIESFIESYVGRSNGASTDRVCATHRMSHTKMGKNDLKMGKPARGQDQLAVSPDYEHKKASYAYLADLSTDPRRACALISCLYLKC